MRRFLSWLGTGISAVGFVCTLLVTWPVLLLLFGIDWVGDRIEATWPESERAHWFRFWFRLLAPLVLIVILMVAIGIAAARVPRRLAGPNPIHGSRASQISTGAHVPQDPP